MINAVLAGQPRVPSQPGQPGQERPAREPVHVSPYMLYALARRYDEFEGEAESGSSLRGALKGWYYHGVLPDTAWPALDTCPEPDLLDPEVMAQAARQPARRLLPRRHRPPRRRPVGGGRAVGGGGLGGHPRRLEPPGPPGPHRRRGRAAAAGHRPDQRVALPRRARVLHRRLQRRRLPGPELLGPRVGQGRLRHPAVRRLARLRLRRLGGAARRPVGGLRARPAQDPGHRGRTARRRTRSGPAAARRARGQPRQRRAPLPHRPLHQRPRPARPRHRADGRTTPGLVGIGSPGTGRALRPRRPQQRTHGPRRRPASAELVAAQRDLPRHLRLADRAGRDHRERAQRPARPPAAGRGLVGEPDRGRRPVGGEPGALPLPLDLGAR